MTGPATDPLHRHDPSGDPSEAPVRVLYIGGSGRSGSTLLDRVLGQIPELCSVGEIVHIWRRGLLGNQLCGCGLAFHDCPFWKRVGMEAFGGWDTIDPEEMLRLQHRVDRNRYIPLMIASWVSPSYRRALDRYAAYLADLYRGIQKASGARVIVDSAKHASYAFLLRHVATVDLHVVHLARDSRGVAYSWTKQVEKPEVVGQIEYMPRYHPARMGFRWVAYNALFHLLRWIGTPSLFLRYESLVRHPRSEVERVLRFAGIEANGERLEYIEDGYVDLEPTHTVAGNPMRFKQGRIALRLDEEWREQMNVRQQRVVGALTWPLMRRYGYRLRGDR